MMLAIGPNPPTFALDSYMAAIPLMVVAPLEDEIRLLRLRLQNPSRLDPDGRLTLAAWGGLPLLLVRTGIGAAAMARTLSSALSSASPGLCLLLGYAGGILPELSPGDLVIATDLIDSREDRLFQVAPERVARAARILEQTGLPGRLGALVSVDRVAFTPADKAAAGTRPGVLALDMESFAFAEVCQDAALPFLVVRSILDPLNLALPQPVNASKTEIKKIWETSPFREVAGLARTSLTAFAIAWLDDMAGNRDRHL
jgi:nucleoside phosphorylase